MSAGARREFLPTLREVERRLSVPVTARIRILRELEADLEALTAQLLGRGLGPEEARTRALEALVPDGSALRRLDRLHAPPYRRLARRIGSDRLRLLERTLLVIATVALLAVASLLVIRGGLLRVPPGHLWPVLATAGLLFSSVVANTLRLWLGEDRRRRWGSGTVLALSGAVLAVGLVVAFVDSYHLLGVLETSPHAAGTEIPRWLLRTSGLLSLSLLIALAGALAWFVMTQWLAAVSAAHRDVLGYGSFGTHESEVRPISPDA